LINIVKYVFIINKFESISRIFYVYYNKLKRIIDYVIDKLKRVM